MCLFSSMPFYGSPPNFSSTKLPVLKPASGRLFSYKVTFATPTSSFGSPLQTQTIFEDSFFKAPFLESTTDRRETLVKENRCFFGAAIAESVVVYTSTSLKFLTAR